MDLNFFDANCYVGRYKAFRQGSFYTLAGLLEQMDYYGISEALVTHALAREHHPADGNEAIMAEVEGQPRIHPVWALLPSASKEQPAPAELIQQMVDLGVNAARIFYGSYKFPISEWCIGETLNILEAHQMPTFIDPDPHTDTVKPDLFDWDAVDALCRNHPNLPVILSEGRFYSSNRILYQLFERHANLLIDLSGLWANRGIEFITREFGAQRLIFSTRMPLRDPSCTIAQVNYAEISDEDKKLIAGDNLRALMGGVL